MATTRGLAAEKAPASVELDTALWGDPDALFYAKLTTARSKLWKMSNRIPVTIHLTKRDLERLMRSAEYALMIKYGSVPKEGVPRGIWGLMLYEIAEGPSRVLVGADVPPG